MPEKMQNLFVLMEPSEDASDTPLKGGNMILNRFCIDEGAAFELSGVNFLKKTSGKKTIHMRHKDSLEFKLKREEKGKEYSI